MLSENQKALRKNSLYYTEKNPHFVRVFSEKIFDLVLKFTCLSIAILFAKWNYDIIIILRVLLTRARSGMVICVPYGNGNKTSTGFWEDSTRLPEYYNGTYVYLKSLGIEEI